MNEQIKALAVRAKIQMCSHERLQEFAELVINECKAALEKTDPTTSQRGIEAINRELGIK
jgi:hypothetical protein